MTRLPYLLILLLLTAIPLAAQSKAKQKPTVAKRPFYRPEQSSRPKPYYRPIQPPANAAHLNKGLTTAIGVEKADILISRAKYYLAAGLEDNARREFDRALAVDPESEAIIVRVAALIAAGGTAERCRRVSDISSNYVAGHSRSDAVIAERAKARKCLGDVDGAFDDLKTALEIAPASDAHFRDLTNLAQGIVDAEKALAIYNKVIDLISVRIVAGNTTSWPSYDRSGLANMYFMRASIYAKIGNKNARLLDMEKAVQLSPGFRSLRARNFEEYQMYDDAIADMTAYIAYVKRSDNPRPQKVFWQEYSFRASIYAKAGRYSEAIADYEKALESLPQNSWIQERINELRLKALENPH